MRSSETGPREPAGFSAKKLGKKSTKGVCIVLDTGAKNCVTIAEVEMRSGEIKLKIPNRVAQGVSELPGHLLFNSERGGA